MKRPPLPCGPEGRRRHPARARRDNDETIWEFLLQEPLVMPHHHLAFDLLGGFQRHAHDDHDGGAA